MNPGARNVEIGDLTSRKNLRTNLKCKSFRWYLENIYPESQMPLDYYYLGEMKNDGTHNCLDTMGRKSGEEVGLSYCHGLGGNQACVYNDEDKTIRHMNTNKCLSTQKNNPNQPKLMECMPSSSYQLWTMGSKFKWQAN